MEPTSETFEQIGRLCNAWAALELATERAVWGILETDEKLGPVITWPLDLRQRWQLILDHGPKRLSEEETKELKAINAALVTVTRDRNIVVHGLVHATIALPEGGSAAYGRTVGKVGDASIVFGQPPCWTVFRGAVAGKRFPVSAQAVEIVRNNIGLLTERVIAFNIRQGYTNLPGRDGPIEKDWPKPLG